MSNPVEQAREPDLVLIVEDEEPLAETISYVVRTAGYEPVIAFHGKQGLQLARDRRPALVITDMMLAYLSGVDLTAALRADATSGGRPAPTIILMTAANLAQARVAGADAVLRKPFRLKDLEGMLDRFLGPAHDHPPSPSD
jgi:DNA-binding response OmpR family regulator